jgi:acyl carrier protein
MVKMSESEILEAISSALTRFAPRKAHALQDVNREHVTLSALGLDSIAMLELIMEIEKATGVTFDDHELVRIDNLMGLVRLIAFKQAAKP